MPIQKLFYSHELNSFIKKNEKQYIINYEFLNVDTFNTYYPLH